MIDWEDNSISDEMLAAYIDGNANADECSLIRNQMAHDFMLTEVIDIVNDMNFLEMSIVNDNLIMPPMETNPDWNYGLDTEPMFYPSPMTGIEDDHSFTASFHSGFEDGEHNDGNSDLNNMFNTQTEDV